MTETIRRVKRSDPAGCKDRAKHERAGNDKHFEALTEIGDSSGSDNVSALDTLSANRSFAGEHSDGIRTQLEEGSGLSRRVRGSINEIGRRPQHF